MLYRRSGVGVIAYNSCVYAVGGFDGVTRMISGEKYNPKTKTWNAINSMYTPRSNFAIEVCLKMRIFMGF
jgi:kelch-like protein 10